MSIQSRDMQMYRGYLLLFVSQAPLPLYPARLAPAARSDPVSQTLAHVSSPVARSSAVTASGLSRPRLSHDTQRESTQGHYREVVEGPQNALICKVQACYLGKAMLLD